MDHLLSRENMVLTEVSANSRLSSDSKVLLLYHFLVVRLLEIRPQAGFLFPKIISNRDNYF